MAFIQLAPKLEFERVDVAEQLLVHLLNQRWIPRKPARIQFAHLVDQRLQLLTSLRTILQGGTNLIQQI